MGHKTHVVLVTLLLAGCGQFGDAGKVRRLVADEMKDPASAQFRGIALEAVPQDGGTTLYACGEVNGRNSFGAYCGALREVTLKEVEITPEAILLWPRSTNPKWSDPVQLDDGAGDDVEVQVTGLLVQAIRRFN